MRILPGQDIPDANYIFRAAAVNKIEILKEFIESGGNINIRGTDNHTLLHRACSNKNPLAVHFLLEHGADPQAKNKWDETPLHIACRLGHDRAADLLLAHGANVNTRDGSGCTPLSWACKNGFLETVNILLSKGADPEIADRYGATAADYAAALKENKIERGKIVGTLFFYGHAVKKFTANQDYGRIPGDKPADTDTEPSSDS